MLIVVPTCRTKSGKPKTSDTVTAKGQESKLQIVTDTDRSKDLFTVGRFPVISSDVSAPLAFPRYSQYIPLF